MRGSTKQLRTKFVVCVVLVSTVLAIHIWKSNDAASSEKARQEPYRFIARNLKYVKNGTLTIYGNFKDRENLDNMLEINNISMIIKEIIKDYEERKAAQKAKWRTHREQFSVSADVNKTLVSYSPLYKIPEINSTPSQNAILPKYFASDPSTRNVNCQLLFQGDTNEVEKALRLSKSLSLKTTEKMFINQTKDCKKFISNRGYIMDSLNEEEKNFSIAYSMMVYKNPEQFEILLRAIYRPQNIYCIHVDKKTPQSVYNEFASIIRCFPNVFLASKRIAVYWGYGSVLTQELVCMADLLKYKKWRYFINLTGQEFPLRTNYEMVKILQIYNGANDLESTIRR